MSRLRKATPWVVGGATGLYLAANLACSAYLNYAFLRPKRKQSRTSDLSDFLPEVDYSTKRTEFRCSDGVVVSALLLEPRVPNGSAIVVCHGLAHDKYSGVRFVQYLLKAGYLLLLIDFRNHGESGGRITTYGYFEKDDLHTSIRYLRETCGVTGRIGVLGASMGASIALLTVAERDDIHGLVADSPFASLHQLTRDHAHKATGLPYPVLSFPVSMTVHSLRLLTGCRIPEVEPAEKVRQLKCPLLLIHGGADIRIPPAHSRTIYENATVEKELWIEDDAGHLGVYLKRRDKYENKVSGFFRKHLLA